MAVVGQRVVAQGGGEVSVPTAVIFLTFWLSAPLFAPWPVQQLLVGALVQTCHLGPSLACRQRGVLDKQSIHPLGKLPNICFCTWGFASPDMMNHTWLTSAKIWT